MVEELTGWQTFLVLLVFVVAPIFQTGYLIWMTRKVIIKRRAGRNNDGEISEINC